MRTKDFRRFMWSTKLDRRIRNYTDINWLGEDLSYADFRNQVKKGESCSWMRTTGKVCSCWMCSSIFKYKRLSASEIKKLINEQCDV